MPAVHVEKAKCRYCSKQFHPAEVSNGRCIYCSDWHNHALEVLSGAVPLGCQECGSTWERLKELTLGDEIKMYVVPKDGIYQLLCKRCCDVYVPVRRDLYAGTAFGQRINL